MTEVVRVDFLQPDPSIIAKAVSLLRSGCLIVYPTETVYGLAASALLPEAVERIYAAKQRPHTQALPVQIGQAADVEMVAVDLSDVAYSLIDQFFPGPLTLILHCQPSVSRVLTGGTDTIGVRMPNHRIALDIIRAYGEPVVCTSANLSGRPSPMCAQDVLNELDGIVDLVFDCGFTEDRIASTVLDLTGDTPRILREGKLTKLELEAHLKVSIDY